MSNRDAYVEKVKAQIDEWNGELERIEEQARKAEADMKLEYEKQLSAMRLQREKAREMVRKVQESGEDVWEELHTDMEAAWDTIVKGFRDAANRFK